MLVSTGMHSGQTLPGNVPAEIHSGQTLKGLSLLKDTRGQPCLELPLWHLIIVLDLLRLA